MLEDVQPILMKTMTQPKPKARIYVTGDLRQGGTVMPEAEQAHYLNLVMRLGPGDTVILFNGRDGEWQAVIESVTKKSCTLILGDKTRQRTRCVASLCAAQKKPH